MTVEYGRLVEGRSQAKDAYDHLACIYDTEYLSSKDLAENAWLARYLNGNGYCDGRVLDVGCGTGLLLDLCAVQPEWYQGIDVSEKMLAVARDKHPRFRFAVGDMERLNKMRPTIEFGSFDSAVYLFGSWSYARDQQAALASLAWVLRPGGKFFIMALSHRYPDRASYSVAKAGFDVPIVTYSPADLYDMFDDVRAFDHLRVRALSINVDRLNSLPPRMLAQYYRLEAQWGRVFTESGAYVCIEGRRE